MRIKVSDYVAQLCLDAGITDGFTVVGGGSMHLNGAFANAKGMHTVYNHHEQACAIAAEAYARINNKLAVLTVTTGPGGTNAITGVVGGWLDSIPMLILSGQVRYATMARSTGLPLRAMGDQEFDITQSIACMTKYCELILDPKRIKYVINKAIYIATHGRPGPCWIDIPLDVQGAFIETDGLEDFDPKEYEDKIPGPVDDSVSRKIIELIEKAERPVFYAGNGIRLSGGYEIFRRVIKKLNVPVVVSWDAVDLLPNDSPLFAGRPGNLGDRAGNFAVQNSDLVISIGSRLNFRQTGFNYEGWARAAYVVMEDVDKYELQKPNVHVDMPIWADAKDLLESLDRVAYDGVFKKTEWLKQCAKWNEEYPVVQKKHYETKDYVNPYAFMNEISKRLPDGSITVTGNGTACAAGSHAYTIKEGTRFILNCAIASMGYDLPAAIGVCVASGGKDVICLTGDGSIMMNFQELQTIVTNKLPVKIFVINNNGYHSMRLTENNLFNGQYFGMGPQSHDLDFPDFSKVAALWDYPYFSIKNNDELCKLDEILNVKGSLICEVFVTINQGFEPKSGTMILEDGTLYSPPLEDLTPFLPRDELKRNMYIE